MMWEIGEVRYYEPLAGGCCFCTKPGVLCRFGKDDMWLPVVLTIALLLYDGIPGWFIGGWVSKEYFI